MPSRGVFQPIGQVKLTNVAVVRMNQKGQRFEIACYRNKVVNWRQGLELDLDEVLQSDRIFVNVSKGEFASSAQLKKAFGTTDPDAIARLILERGDVQVSDLERNQHYESLQREIATNISDHCVNPSSGYPYTVAQIRQAMKEANYIVHPTRTIKRQYLDCIKLIQQRGVLKLERAKMELLLAVEDYLSEAKEELKRLNVAPTKEEGGNLTVLVDPSLYRPLQDFIKGKGRIEILRQVVKREGDSSLVAAAAASSKEDQGHLASLTQSQLQMQQQELEEEEEETVPKPVNKSKRKKTKKEKRREKELAARKAEQAQQQLQHDVPSSDSQCKPTSTPASSLPDGMKACNTCGGAFTPTEYRAHFRSDWHRYNQKLKLKGMPAVSEREFLVCDSDAFFNNM